MIEFFLILTKDDEWQVWRDVDPPEPWKKKFSFEVVAADGYGGLDLDALELMTKDDEVPGEWKEIPTFHKVEM